MVKSKISIDDIDDKLRTEILRQELEKFNKVAKGHRKLLAAIGKL